MGYCRVTTLLQAMGLSATDKTSQIERVVGVAHSLAMNENQLPGWFFSVDYDQVSTAEQKQLWQQALTLYALLRDEESWYGCMTSRTSKAIDLIDVSS